MIRETWRPVVGYEGIYSVSSRGSIRREISRTCAKAGTILKQSLRNGYPAVNLCRNGAVKFTSVHTIVARAFLGPCPDGMVPNHKNGKRDDNCKTNLEYGTQSHNVKEAYRLGLRDCRGSGNGRAKLDEASVVQIRKCDKNEYPDLAIFYGVTLETIKTVAARRAWTHVP